MRIYFLYILFLVLFCSCVSDFVPEVKDLRGILVVDGAITNGESVIKLSRSVGITETLIGDEVITHATMWIERSDGTIFPAVHAGQGSYRIQVGDLDLDLQYRLDFTVDGKKYESSFLSPIQTVEIESLSFEKKERDDPVCISLTSVGGKETSRYYKWNYQENWEVKARYYATHGYVNGVLTEYSLHTSLNSYYCWGQDSSKTLLLGTTDDLSENNLSNRKLYEIPSSDDKISILYHVEVSQMQLRKEAYDYFHILLDEIERTGGLFNIVMSAGDNGNIYSLSDPNEVIIGFIEVANVTKKGMFIPHDDVYVPPVEFCELYVAPNNILVRPWVQYFDLIYSSWRCVDCRERYNATKNKPSWWPTDHL